MYGVAYSSSTRREDLAPEQQTITLLPMAFLLNWQMYLKGRAMFRSENLKVRANALGFVFYVFAYGLILQPACVYGYFSELFNLRKSWGTK